MRSLEARVAELEAQLAAAQAGAGVHSIPYEIASKVAQATVSFGLPRPGPYLNNNMSSTLLFCPSCPPLAVVRTRGAAPPAEEPASSPGKSPLRGNAERQQYSSNLINLNSIPSAAILRMIRNYADIHLPQYPIITDSMLDGIAKRVQDDDLGDTSALLLYGIPAESSLGHFDYFVLFIVLAISAMTLTWKAEDQALAASESFYNSALKHLQALGEHSEMCGLQISLLLAHYAHMRPERVDNWTCISNAVRIMLNLGLYKECPEALDSEARRLRHVLFWVTYGMERSLSSNLRLPLSFPEEVITTKVRSRSLIFRTLPSVIPVSYVAQLDFGADINHDSIFAAEDARKKASAKYICLYRQFETEVHRVMHLQDDPPETTGATLESWIQDITRRLTAWYEEAKTYAEYGMLEFKHVQFHHLRARIHRPTPRLATRTDADRKIVLECALALIDDYGAQEGSRRLFYPWHGVHILFETAVIALDACWLSAGGGAGGGGPPRPWVAEMLDVQLPRCLRLLTNIGRRWGEATASAERLSPLLSRVTAAFAAGPEFVGAEETAAITQEIQGLLFSDGSLTWNTNPLWGGEPALDDLQFLDDSMFDNLEFLQWGPEWDIMSADVGDTPLFG